MEQFLLFGKNGQLLRERLYCLDDLQRESKAPTVEIDVDDCFNKRKLVKPAIKPGELCSYDITSIVQEQYSQWGKFGPDGDVVGITSHKRGVYKIDFIGRLVYPKPGLAADLLPFVRDKRGQLFFIGIIRKNNPGKGEPALIGGFRNVKGYHFASAAETIISEGKEESGLKVVVCNDVIMNDVKKIINLREFRAKIVIGDIEKYSYVQLVGTYHASGDEELSTTGYKRVYETTAYAFVIDVDEELSEESLAAKLKAGDDAQDIFVWNLTRRGGSPKLAFAHHDEILIDALKIIS